MLTSKTTKAIILALTASTLLATGCASKKPKSQVVVAPLGSHLQGGGYQGGSLAQNSDAIRDAAKSLPNVVYFDFNSDAIKPQAANVLNTQAQFLIANQGAKVVVAGHTDERGTREYNMSLGERRAAAVRAYLTGKGVNAGSVEIISFGEEQPAATGSNEASWSKNRRAELSY